MTKKPRYVSHYYDARGKLRWRFRKAGLPESQTTEVFGSSEWWAWYAQALSATPKSHANVEPGTIHALAIEYYRSSDFMKLKPSTRKTYKGILDRYRQDHGAKPANRMEPRHIRKQMDDKANEPAAANNMLKVLRALMKFAVSRGLLQADPTYGVRMIAYASDGFHTWTEAEIQAFESRWAIGTNERLGFDLLLYTAQRSADVRRMTWKHVGDGRVIVTQEKTGQPIDIPIHPRLRTSLEVCTAGAGTIIKTKLGKSFSEKGFGNWVKKAAIAAGLPHCSAHGLRKAAARRLAEAGCTAHEIMSITGHQTLSEVERYTRDASRKALADTAMNRII
ncbi:MAG: tyrosine-type recombinase/integrase [Janthinobacterium lividum]